MDAFELHRIQKEANIKRMKFEQRLNFPSARTQMGDITQRSRSEPIHKTVNIDYRSLDTLASKRKVTKIDHRSLKPAVRREYHRRTPFGSLDINIQTDQRDGTKRGGAEVRDLVMKLHRHTHIPTTKSPPVDTSKVSVPVSQLIPKFSRVSDFKRNGFNNRYLDITKEILHRLPQDATKDMQSPVDQARIYIGTFVRWFKFHRYDYVVVDRDIANTRGRLSYTRETLKEDALQSSSTLFKDNKECDGVQDSSITIKNTNSKIHENPQGISGNFDKEVSSETEPTHIALKATTIGKFLYSVKVKNIQTQISSVVMLTQTDVRFVIEENDLLILPQGMISLQNIMGRQVAFYMKWQVLRESAIDINFFQ